MSGERNTTLRVNTIKSNVQEIMNFLKESGVALNRTAVDYALSAINDWIIYENDLDEECTTYQYQLKQMLKKCGLEIK